MGRGLLHQLKNKDPLGDSVLGSREVGKSMKWQTLLKVLGTTLGLNGVDGGFRNLAVAPNLKVAVCKVTIYDRFQIHLRWKPPDYLYINGIGY